MDWEGVRKQRQAHRAKRLLDACDRVGGKAELGRMLGYKDGSYVGQMIRGEREISEETVAKLEAMRGWSGWFNPQAKASSWPFDLVSQAKWEKLTEQERGYVQAATNHAIEECERRRAGESAPQVAPATIAPTVNRNHGKRTKSGWQEIKTKSKRGAG